MLMILFLYTVYCNIWLMMHYNPAFYFTLMPDAKLTLFKTNPDSAGLYFTLV